MNMAKISGLGNLPQSQIDWTRAVHNQENNKFSQKHLDKNRQKFTGQAAIILTVLQQGRRLNADYARNLHHVKHLARRIGDIGEKMGIDVDREWGKDGAGDQESELVYFLPENRAEFSRKGWIIDRKRWWFSEKYTPLGIINSVKKANESKS